MGHDDMPQAARKGVVMSGYDKNCRATKAMVLWTHTTRRVLQVAGQTLLAVRLQLRACRRHRACDRWRGMQMAHAHN